MSTLSKKIAIILAICLISSLSQAATVTLMWDRPSAGQEAITHGYRIYTHGEGESYDMTSPAKWGWKGQFCDSSVCYTTFENINEKTYFIATAFTSTEDTDKSTWPESPPSNEVIFIIPDTNAIDDDADGYSENDGDCDDTNGAIYPGAMEVCEDGIDNNCDGEIDEGCPGQVPEKVTLQIKAIEGSYIWDGTKWYKITTGGLVEVPNEPSD